MVNNVHLSTIKQLDCLPLSTAVLAALQINTAATGVDHVQLPVLVEAVQWLRSCTAAQLQCLQDTSAVFTPQVTSIMMIAMIAMSDQPGIALPLKTPLVPAGLGIILCCVCSVKKGWSLE